MPAWDQTFGKTAVIDDLKLNETPQLVTFVLIFSFPLLGFLFFRGRNPLQVKYLSDEHSVTAQLWCNGNLLWELDQSSKYRLSLRLVLAVLVNLPVTLAMFLANPYFYNRNCQTPECKAKIWEKADWVPLAFIPCVLIWGVFPPKIVRDGLHVLSFAILFFDSLYVIKKTTEEGTSEFAQWMSGACTLTWNVTAWAWLALPVLFGLSNLLAVVETGVRARAWLAELGRKRLCGDAEYRLHRAALAVARGGGDLSAVLAGPAAPPGDLLTPLDPGPFEELMRFNQQVNAGMWEVEQHELRLAFLESFRVLRCTLQVYAVILFVEMVLATVEIAWVFAEQPLGTALRSWLQWGWHAQLLQENDPAAYVLMVIFFLFLVAAVVADVLSARVAQSVAQQREIIRLRVKKLLKDQDGKSAWKEVGRVDIGVLAHVLAAHPASAAAAAGEGEGEGEGEGAGLSEALFRAHVVPHLHRLTGGGLTPEAVARARGHEAFADRCAAAAAAEAAAPAAAEPSPWRQARARLSHGASAALRRASLELGLGARGGGRGAHHEAPSRFQAMLNTLWGLRRGGAARGGGGGCGAAGRRAQYRKLAAEAPFYLPVMHVVSLEDLERIGAIPKREGLHYQIARRSSVEVGQLKRIDTASKVFFQSRPRLHCALRLLAAVASFPFFVAWCYLYQIPRQAFHGRWVLDLLSGQPQDKKEVATVLPSNNDRLETDVENNISKNAASQHEEVEEFDHSQAAATYYQYQMSASEVEIAGVQQAKKKKNDNTKSNVVISSLQARATHILNFPLERLLGHLASNKSRNNTIDLVILVATWSVPALLSIAAAVVAWLVRSILVTAQGWFDPRVAVAQWRGALPTGSGSPFPQRLGRAVAACLSLPLFYIRWVAWDGPRLTLLLGRQALRAATEGCRGRRGGGGTLRGKEAWAWWRRPHFRPDLDPRPAPKPVDQLPEGAEVVFVSHRWLRSGVGFPDDAAGTKWARLLALGHSLAGRLGKSKENLYLWVDYASFFLGYSSGSHSILMKTCCNQADFMHDIYSLGLIVNACDHFAWMEHPEYAARGWCRLEQYLWRRLGASNAAGTSEGSGEAAAAAMVTLQSHGEGRAAAAGEAFPSNDDSKVFPAEMVLASAGGREEMLGEEGGKLRGQDGMAENYQEVPMWRLQEKTDEVQLEYHLPLIIAPTKNDAPLSSAVGAEASSTDNCLGTLHVADERPSEGELAEESDRVALWFLEKLLESDMGDELWRFKPTGGGPPLN